jgi:hypothetical protein
MNIAKQAMENREYVRRLLEEKQPGFAASLELAVSISHRQIAAGGNGAARRGSRSASSADTGRRLK